MNRAIEREFPIAFVGTYVPRRCGIATFTRDLASAVAKADERVEPMVIAVTDSGGEYEYPDEVKYEIRQGVVGDYARAAEFVNYSSVKLVSIQHEYGIFGGVDGSYVLDFLEALHVPAIVTLHTVLQKPSVSQKAIVQHMAKRAANLVVMSQIAADLLASSYGVKGSQVRIIPHGIPQMDPGEQDRSKAKFGVVGQTMLLTFGLLSPNKGIETVIRALPAVAADFPEMRYFVVGATHPMVVRQYGEAYRTTLEQEAEQLGVRDRVVFRDQFISAGELRHYLQAADIFISPYLNRAQVTSGALSYAMGAGSAVVSTPYWHAEELLAEGRGHLFPFQDSKALSDSLRKLLGSREERERMSKAAFDFTRSMIWPRVGDAYVELALQASAQAQPKPLRWESPRASSLPELRLDHLNRLTDYTGIIQHATYSVPARSSGYCVDDNARALIVALHADRGHGSPETQRLITTYLSYLLHSQDEDGHFKNFLNYDRSFQDGPRSDDCIGRAVWALGTTIHLASDAGCQQLARDMFERSLGSVEHLGPRGSALVIMGLACFLMVEPDAKRERDLLSDLAAALVARYQSEVTDDWHWFEPELTYDNAMLPLALLKAYRITGDRTCLRVARESLDFLEAACFHGDSLRLVGNSGWHSRGGTKADADEQAIDAAAFVLAFRGAYLATSDRHYLRRMRQAFAWFLGTNRLGVPLYDFATAGCLDGLGQSAPNQNQGAESTISFLMALLGVLEFAGESPKLAEAMLAIEGVK